MVVREFVVEEVRSQYEGARYQMQRDRAKRNSDWLQGHWADLLPRARGKFVAVAGQEAFIADTYEEAWALAGSAHPEDDGALCQFVFPHEGPRNYAYRRRMAEMR
jgi:hypothetical protein